VPLAFGGFALVICRILRGYGDNQASQKGTPMTPRHVRVPDQFEANFPENCQAVSAVLSRVGDKWSLLIVVLLGIQPRADSVSSSA
jgi:hypothetical protein